MRIVLLNTWALFLSFAIISLGHGLQGTLIGVRAILEGFSFISTGLIIAGYYFGFLGGSIVIPLFIKRVGHIRVFAALASLASIAILLHSLFLDPTLWFFPRVVLVDLLFSQLSIIIKIPAIQNPVNMRIKNQSVGSRNKE